MTQETIEKYKIAKIVDGSKGFVGTCFFVRQDYCVTCHHNIAHMENIHVEADKKVVAATWVEEYSDLERDIAILRVENEEEFEPFVCALETEGETSVKVHQTSLSVHGMHYHN